jgi:hypothetical protein
MSLLLLYRSGEPVEADVSLAESAFVSAGAVTNTTAQMTPPAGKTNADFQQGKISDDTNPLPAINLTAGKYTELELVVQISPDAELGDYEFRISKAGTPLDDYLVTPVVTVSDVVVHELAGSLAGVSVSTALLGAQRPLVGSLVGASAVSGAAGLRKALAGTVAGTSAVSPALMRRTLALLGSVSGVSSLPAPSLTVTHIEELAGLVAGLSAVGATPLLVVRNIAGTLAGVSAVSPALLRRSIPLAVTIPAVSSFNTLSITRRFNLTGAVAGVSTFVSPQLGIFHTEELAGTLAALSALTNAPLLVSRNIAGTMVAVSAIGPAVMSRTLRLQGNVAGVSNIPPALLQRTISMVSSLLGASGFSGLPLGVFRDTPISGAMTAVVTFVPPVLRVNRLMQGNLTGTSGIASALLRRSMPLAGSSVSASTIAPASLLRWMTLAGTVASTGTVSNALLRRWMALSGDVAGTSTVASALLRVRRDMVATLNIASFFDVDLDVLGTVELIGDVISEAALAGAVNVNRLMTGVVGGVSSVQSALTFIHYIQSVLETESAVSAEVDRLVGLRGSVFALSQLTTHLSLALLLHGNLTIVSQLTANLAPLSNVLPTFGGRIFVVDDFSGKVSRRDEFSGKARII